MAKRKKSAAGSVELTETQLDEVQGGIEIGALKAGATEVLTTITDGTSNTIFVQKVRQS